MKNCPTCQSDQVKKTSLIHAEGVHSSVGVGVGIASGGVGAGVGVGASSSALAAACAPPKKDKDAFMKQSGGVLALIFVVPLFVATAAYGSWAETGFFWKAWAALGFTLMVWLNYKFDKTQEENFEQIKADYEKTYMCLRCGHFYKPFE